MFPELFEIPGLKFTLYTYGLLIMLAFVAAMVSASKLAVRDGISKDLIVDLGILGMVTGVLGAKLNHVLQYPNEYGGDQPLFAIADGGLSPLWGIVGGAIPYVGWLLLTRRPDRKMTPIVFVVVALLTLLLAVAGARVGYVASHRDQYPRYVWDPVLKNWRAGFVLYGGLIAGVVSGALYIKLKRESVLKVGDAAAPGMALAIGIGRLGCFFQGCCYGAPSTVAWAVTYPKDSPVWVAHTHAGTIGWEAARSAPVHPVQVYEFLAGAGMFFLLWWIWKRRRAHGQVLMALGILYALWRYVAELLRSDQRPVWWLGQTYSQWVSVAVLLACVIGLAWVSRRGARPAPA
jgi:phosphatidylglycerol:prolipoprotein diacylglycerol transferase